MYKDKRSCAIWTKNAESTITVTSLPQLAGTTATSLSIRILHSATTTSRNTQQIFSSDCKISDVKMANINGQIPSETVGEDKASPPPEPKIPSTETPVIHCMFYSKDVPVQREGKPLRKGPKVSDADLDGLMDLCEAHRREPEDRPEMPISGLLEADRDVEILDTNGRVHLIATEDKDEPVVSIQMSINKFRILFQEMRSFRRNEVAYIKAGDDLYNLIRLPQRDAYKQLLSLHSLKKSGASATEIEQCQQRLDELNAISEDASRRGQVFTEKQKHASMKMQDVREGISRTLERVYMDANLLPSLENSLKPYGIRYNPYDMGDTTDSSEYSSSTGSPRKSSAENSVESSPVEYSPVVSLTGSLGVSSIDDEREDQDN